MNIVDRLKDSLDYEFNLTYSEHKQLLDYITNLQKENKELNKMCEIYSKSLYNADLKKAEQEVDRLNNIINELEKILENEWIYYEQIVFNTHAEFDDEEQVNRFWQEYGAKLMLKNIQDKLQELKDSD